MAFRNLLLERGEGIAVVTVNRPRVLNALNEATLSELEAAFKELETDDEVRAIILTGAGDRAFIAGADINELRALSSAHQAQAFARRGQELLAHIENLEKPVIAAINGYALGGGCEIAMACDIRLAADTAKLGQPEINLGIIPGYGGTQRLPRLVGRGMAKLLILTGDMIDAHEALRIGLVDRVVPAARLMDEARALARTLAEKPPIALALAKRAINVGMELDLASGCAYEASLFGLACATEDRVEGTSAFLEKRKPHFRGR